MADNVSPLPAALDGQVTQRNSVTATLRIRRSMNFANAIPPKRNTHSTPNTAMLFVGVGTRLSRDKARRIAANIRELPELF